MKKYRLIKSISLYSILVGSAIILFWTWFLLTQVSEEGVTELTFHIFSEILMAVLCIAAGFLFLKFQTIELLLAGHAMLVYSTLNAAGFYSERGEIAMSIMFILLFLISLSVMILLILKKIRL